MCNVSEELQKLKYDMQGHSVGELFPETVMGRVPYENVRSGHCLICGRGLRDHEMWPRYRCPRCMCEHCYQAEVLRKINYNCIISGEPLPQWKISAQQTDRREVLYNIADGPARDYYILLACKIVGVDLGFLRNDFSDYQHEYTEGIYEVLDTPQDHQRLRSLPYPQQMNKALPSPGQGDQVPIFLKDFLRARDQLMEAIDATKKVVMHNKKRARYIPK